ncbi:MAG: IS1182 family transposase [Nitrososphaerota archaeon]|nr:IS1182 family transposase [Nitrososphaerota archaeon]
MSVDKHGYVKGIDRSQEILLPKTVDEYIDKENPVRFIDAFVGSLDMDSLDFEHSEPCGVGRPPYNPADLLKLYIDGYLKHIRSSRLLEEACATNLETIWLMKGLTPDFKTISDFRKENIDSIKPVFKQFIYLCKALDLFGSELVGIDGSKFKAVNSRKRNFNQQTIKEKLEHIEERIESYLEQIEANDQNEEEATPQRFDAREKERLSPSLKEKIAKLEDKRKEYVQIQENMRKTGQKEISLTDHESRLMKCGQGLDVCYNVETAVDSKNSLIVDYDVTNDASDRNELSKLAKSAKKILVVERLDVTADKGFHKISEIKDCLEVGITPYVPEPEQHGWHKNGVPTRDFYDDKFVYDKSRDLYVCPAGDEMKLWNWFKEGKTGTNFKL